jgi:hypothetical protein
MKKISQMLVLICVCSSLNFATAQGATDGYEKNFKFGVGLNGGLPLNDPYTFNVGADVRLQYNISASYSLCLTVGYNNLFVENNGPDLGYVPIKVGYKTFLFKNEFYVMGEMGGAFGTTKAYDANSILFSPSIGYATKYVDISIGYQFLKDFPMVKDNVADNGLAQVMLRLAYGFNL